ncbi:MULTISPECIES: 2Fe-2S iron-sulfur cluster binding domain-containing protein [unclassified Streptomyces]|uniref:2Fe-2S iron-sulfur cluster-binding protein n=1 Tax=unclassified Streptomyces TaxID=2593676 RepID=UPI0033A443F3
MAAGLPMPYSCTVGNCGDCMVRLRRGEVAQSGPNRLTERQKADGYVLACTGVRCRRSRSTSRTPDHPPGLRRRCPACRPPR